MPKVSPAHQEARRAQILEAACKCFARKGFHQTTVREICSESGLSAGAIYGYFSGKEAIVEALAEMGRRNTRRLLEQGDSTTASRSPAEMLDHALGILDSDRAAESVRLDVRLWGEGLHTPQLRKLFLQALPNAAEPFAARVREAQRRGRIDPDLDPATVGRVCVALCLGMTVFKAMDPETSIVEESRVVASLFDGSFSGPGSDS